MSEEYIDLNEVVEVSEDGDAYAEPDPPAAGIYYVKLFFQDDSEKSVRTSRAKDGQVMFSATLRAEILRAEDPESEHNVGRQVRFIRINSYVSQFSRTSEADTLLKYYGKAPGAGATVAARLEAFKGFVSSEQIVRAAIDWEARVYDKDAKKDVFVKRGMHTFPKREDGSYNPVVSYVHNGETKQIRAGAVIARFLPLE